MKNKIKKVRLFISKDVRNRFPDLHEVLMPVFGVNVKKDENILHEDDFKNLLGNSSESVFFGQKDFELFREFANDLKVNLTKNPASVEFLYKRYNKTGKIPHVNNVVDSANKIALETLIATGTFDMDKIEGDMQLRFTTEGEEFRPLGGDVEYLPAGLVVIADSKKILNLFPFRDSVYQKITEKTKNVLVLADKMPGQDLEKVKKAVSQVADLLVKNGGGKQGDMYLAEESSSKISILNLKETGKVGGVKRVLAGMRATGRLHLGNYLGGAKGMLALQDDPDYETLYMVADMHGVTTPYNISDLQKNRREMVLDYLAVGLDPEKSLLFEQSEISLHGELAFYLSSVVTIARMQHLPTFKEKVKQYPEGSTMALLNYPVLMAADILIYKAGLVPVGIDQEPHLEVAREIARKMNDTYGTDFPEPKRFATKGEYVPSLTGEGKMSKSVEGSYIQLTDDLETIKKRLSVAPTDSGKGDFVPAYGGVANLLQFVELFEGEEKRKVYEKNYVTEGIRYWDMKEELAQAIFAELQPIQERRKVYASDPSLVDRILREGAEKARTIASDTIVEVKEKMGLH